MVTLQYARPKEIQLGGLASMGQISGDLKNPIRKHDSTDTTSRTGSKNEEMKLLRRQPTCFVRFISIVNCCMRCTSKETTSIGLVLRTFGSWQSVLTEVLVEDVRRLST